METLSSSLMGHTRPIKISMSMTSPISLTRNHVVVGLPKQTIRMPRTSPPPTEEMGLEPAPVTPILNFPSNTTTIRANNININTNKDYRSGRCAHTRLNKFVRRLHDMLIQEKHSGIVEWRRGLLVLFSTDAFTKSILPKYFNTRNFKTFRRQLNYYGFVHVRSLSTTGNTTTALWINQHLAEDEANDDVSAVLKLRRVEPNEVAKTVEGRRLRKELAIHTVEEDIGLSSKKLQMDQIRSMAVRGESMRSRYQPCFSAVKFLKPRITSSQGHNTHSNPPTSHIPPSMVHSENSMSSNSSSSSSSTGGPTNYSSSNDDASAGESSNFPVSMPKQKAEAANTDAAASVLLMLSRS